LNRLRCWRCGVRNRCRRFGLPDCRWRTWREACRFGWCHARILLTLRQIFLRSACAWWRANHIGFGARWHRWRLNLRRRNTIELRRLSKRRRIVAGQRRLCFHTAIRDRLGDDRRRNSGR
jgi:hypothetical protein